MTWDSSTNKLNMFLGNKLVSDSDKHHQINPHYFSTKDELKNAISDWTQNQPSALKKYGEIIAGNIIKA